MTLSTAEAIFLAMANVEPQDRNAFLDERCEGDPALRAEIEGSWGGTAPAPDRYVDLRYYEKAKHRVGH